MLKYTLLVIAFVSFSCSDSEGQTTNCYQEDNREIIETVTNFTGTILGPES